MEQALKLQFKNKKRYWNTLPWSEAECALTSFQSYVFKATQRKDTFNRKKLNFSITRDARWNLLAVRRNSERKRPTLFFKTFLFKKNCYLNVFFLEFLKFKTLQSSQRFKLAKIFTNNPLFSKNLLEADLICYFLNSIFLDENLIVFQALSNALKKSFSNKRYTAYLSDEEKIYSFFFKRLFEAFPNKKTFQAFQFYWILLLTNQERVQFFIEPESQVSIEPNISSLKFVSFSNKSNPENLLKHQPLFSFKSFLNTNSWKAIYDKNQHPFLSGFLKSFSLKIFLRKWNWFQSFLLLRKTISCNLLKNLSFHGFMRARGFFINLVGEKKGFFYLKMLCLQPFFLIGLDLDLKKWQQCKLLVRQEMLFLPKVFSSPCFFLATCEDKFLFFHCNRKFFSDIFKFVNDWLFFSLSTTSFKFLLLSNLLRGLEIQNHSITLKEVRSFKKPSRSLLPSSKGLKVQDSVTLRGRHQKSNGIFAGTGIVNGSARDGTDANYSKNAMPLKLKWHRRCARKVFLAKRKAEIELVKISSILEIIPSKRYQKRFFQSIKKIFIQSRGKSSRILILLLISIFSSWEAGIFDNGRTISLRKMFRKIDSLLHFKLFRWARRNHPTWGRQKIVERYFPRGKIWSYAMRKSAENWVFCDPFSLVTPLFLKRLSWFERKNFQRIIFFEFILSGFF